jgi:hypothetical protein
MKVTLRTNLGGPDAKALALEPADCLAGKTIDVKKEVGEALIKSGAAVAEEDAEDDPLIASAQEETARREQLEAEAKHQKGQPTEAKQKAVPPPNQPKH